MVSHDLAVPQLIKIFVYYIKKAILSSPAWLVTSVRGSMSGALTSALKIGLTYPPMAEWPLSALEHWQTTLPFSSFDSILEDVLPYLEPYLNTVEQLAREVPFISAKRFARAKTSSIPRVSSYQFCFCRATFRFFFRNMLIGTKYNVES